MLNTKVNEEYKKKIVAIANEHYQSIVGKEYEEDKDFINYPHLFLLGCVMDSQMKADKAWQIPNIIAEELGGKDFSLFYEKDLAWYREQFEKKKLHRFNEVMSGAFYAAIIKIKEDYNGDASNIWNDEPSSADLVCRLLEFKKIGIKIATMAANLLCRGYGVKLKDKYAIEISPDIHVKRTMYRLGLLPEQDNVDFKNIDANKVIYAAKSLNPEFPGVLDPVCWYVGYHKICTNDGCMDGINGHCPFSAFCIKQQKGSMKYYKWTPCKNVVVVLRKNGDKGYEPYFNKKIGFAYDFYDDYITDFLSDKKNRPETIVEISEKEALELVSAQ